MKLTFLTAYPTFALQLCSDGVLKRAKSTGHIQVDIVDLRDFAIDARGTVDDRPYGGGEGMILRPEPVAKALASIPGEKTVLLPSPSGKIWKQSSAMDFAKRESAGETLHLIFLCPRFGGVDQRAIDAYVDHEISLGDFVISNGEMAAGILADSIVRLLPGVLGDPDSASFDSFGEGCGGQLEAAQYTRPHEFEGAQVPEDLLSGSHQRITSWRQRNSFKRTSERRPDLINTDI